MSQEETIQDKGCTDIFAQTQGLIFIFDTTNKDLCIQYNRALKYRYDTSVVTLSSYDDNDIFPSCAGKFVRPTTSNITKGITWQLKVIKKDQMVILSILGRLSPDVANLILKAFQKCKKKISLLCISTEEDTFKNFTTLQIPVIVITGKTDILLPLFDGRIINPKDFSQKSSIKISSNASGNEILDRKILCPLEKPWVY